MNNRDAQKLLTHLYQKGVASALAETCLPRCLPKDAPEGRTLILGAGKAAAEMAKVAAQNLSGDISGLVVTRYGHGVDEAIPKFEVIEAAHPVPDAMSLEAAARMLALTATLGPKDRLVFLASGGGSSLLASPASGLAFEAKQALMRHLLHSGATIHDINCVRRHLSTIKGGRLALAAGDAEVFTYVISDVPGDSIHDVASGPTVADPTSLADARAVIIRYGAPDPAAVLELLSRKENETPSESPRKWHTHLVANASDCLTAAEKAATAKGLKVINLGPDLEGEARELGTAHARLALERRDSGVPTLILSGGETTVSVKNPSGAGGRNMEYALGLTIGLRGAEGIHALAADTDGIDGSEDAAGAFLHPDTLTRASASGLLAQAMLDNNLSYRFFAGLDDLLVTGPTRTNVNDFRAILVNPPEE
ncbi:MAG: glycerate kinase [Alphaproteobacteria bacterium]|nr:glycerate kinase [Alphaproteobacteria bacterium]